MCNFIQETCTGMTVYVRMSIILQAGWSPLMCATKYGHVRLVETLVEKGAKVDLTGPVRARK